MPDQKLNTAADLDAQVSDADALTDLLIKAADVGDRIEARAKVMAAASVHVEPTTPPSTPTPTPIPQPVPNVWGWVANASSPGSALEVTDKGFVATSTVNDDHSLITGTTVYTIPSGSTVDVKVDVDSTGPTRLFVNRYAPLGAFLDQVFGPQGTGPGTRSVRVSGPCQLQVIAESLDGARAVWSLPRVEGVVTTPVPPPTPTPTPTPVVSGGFALLWNDSTPIATLQTYLNEGRRLFSFNPWHTSERDFVRSKQAQALVYAKPNETGTPFGTVPDAWKTTGSSWPGTTPLNTNNLDLQTAFLNYLATYCDGPWDGVWIDNLFGVSLAFIDKMVKVAHDRGKKIGGNFVKVNRRGSPTDPHTVEWALEYAKRLDFTVNEFWMGGWDPNRWDDGGEAIQGAWADGCNALGKPWWARMDVIPGQEQFLKDGYAAFKRHNPKGLGSFCAMKANALNTASGIWPVSAYA